LSHARNLRAIGQSLELTRVDVFKLENHGASYLVRSQAITPTCYWMISGNLAENVENQVTDAKPSSLKGGEGWLQYEPLIIARLDAQARKKRRGYISSPSQSASKSSQRLRTLGAHLDRVEATVFTISWDYPHGVTVDYQSSDGQQEQRTFSFEKLDQLGFHMRIRRSSRSL
jgi:hypothetical protein